jgi:hypothetical protein
MNPFRHLSGMQTSRVLDSSLNIVLISLIFVCVFDPAGKLLGLKEVLFVLSWILFLFSVIATGKIAYIPLGMTLYLALFIFLIPLTSLAYYVLTNDDLLHFDGYMYFKSYLFLTVVFILYVSKIDLIKQTVAILSLLSFTTLLILILSAVYPSLAPLLLDAVGAPYGIFVTGSRGFDELPFPQVFFHTSRLIVFPLAFFTVLVLQSIGFRRMLYGFLLSINMAAMFAGATRANMIVCILTPLIVAFWYSKKRLILSLVAVILFSAIYFSHLESIQGMLDPDETSNAYKLSFFRDYLSLFEDPHVFLFGQGLGSYFDTSMRGYVSLTELTYFEFIRRFGILLSTIVFIMLLYPLSKLFMRKYHSAHYIFISYLIYLIMCYSNPLLMSSTGMLVLSIVLYYTFSLPSGSGEVPHGSH